MMPWQEMNNFMALRAKIFIRENDPFIKNAEPAHPQDMQVQKKVIFNCRSEFYGQH
jgi:hypothetical protein